MTTGLVIVAAGSSERMEGTDKIWAQLGSRPMIWWSLHQLAPGVDACSLVVRPDRLRDARALLEPEFSDVNVVPGGRVRQESVYLGLQSLPRVDYVAVHDAARPFASPDLLHSGLTALSSAEGAVPVEAVKDTIKRVDGDGVVERTLDRSVLRACQTPQVFRAEPLLRAHQEAIVSGAKATDDAALVEAQGGRVVTFAGDWTNFKITSARDLHLARILIETAQVELQ